MTVDFEKYHLKDKWIPSSPTEGYKPIMNYVRRSDVLQLGEKHTCQVAVIAPSGYGDERIVSHMGYASGEAPLKHFFQDFGNPHIANPMLSINWAIESHPKENKVRSGDLPVIQIYFERNGYNRRFVISSFLIDNLTSKREKRYFMNMESDSNASEVEKATIIASTRQNIEFASKLSHLKVKSGIFGPLFKNIPIPKGVLDFRKEVLGLVSSDLPDAGHETELSKGIYTVNVTDFTLSTDGFKGRSITMRSLADINTAINRRKHLQMDEHRPAQKTASMLGHTTEEIYAAKLKAGLYDLVQSGYVNNVGGFQVTNTKIVRELENERILNFNILLESDGKVVGYKNDDVSSLFLLIYGRSLR